MNKQSVKKSTDYDRFLISKFNRPINMNTKRHKAMVADMEVNGFNPDRPIEVKNILGSSLFLIKDGHHRYMAAKELNIPFYYVECVTDYDVRKYNSMTEPWKISDFVHVGIQQGNSHYIYLKKFSDAFGIPLLKAACLLRRSVYHTPVLNRIEKGTFEVVDADFARKVASVVFKISEIYKRARQSVFVDTVFAICLVDEIDTDKLVKNCIRHPDKLKPYATKESILLMLEDIYNYGNKSSKMIPVAVLAQNALNNRKRECKKPDVEQP